MNEGVFFAVEKINLPWSFSENNFLLAIIITFGFIFVRLLFCYFLPKIKNTISSTSPKWQLPHPQEGEFYSKLLQVFQQFLSYKYLPKNTSAHSYNDIAKYCNNKNILQLYKELETAIFQQHNIHYNNPSIKQSLYDSIHLIIFESRD